MNGTIKKLIGIFGFTLVLALVSNLSLSQGAAADSVDSVPDCTTHYTSHSGFYAKLNIKFKKSDGTVIHPAFTLQTLCPGAYGITSHDDSSSHVDSVSVAAGDSSFFAQSYNGGNGHALDCTQTHTDGTYLNGTYRSIFNVNITDSHYQDPADGTWTSNGPDHFGVTNGATSTVTYIFTPKPPATVYHTAEALVYINGENSCPSAFTSAITLYAGSKSGKVCDISDTKIVDGNNATYKFTGTLPPGYTYVNATSYKGATTAKTVTLTNMQSDHAVVFHFSYVPVSTFRAPTGTLQTASCSVINGYAQDHNVPAVAGIIVNIYAYPHGATPNGTSNAVWYSIKGHNQINANKASPGPAGNHGFSIATPDEVKDGGSYDIYAYAVNGKTPTNVVELTGSPKVISPCSVPIAHKVFNVNFLKIAATAIRDNETFAFQLLDYMFPDAGLKGGAFHLWQNGVYDNATSRSTSDSSSNAALDAITSLNNKAEQNCTADTATLCRDSVPLAYVPQSDGTTSPGNTTPNGNIWYALREDLISGADPKKGGIASNDLTSVGGYSGVHLNKVEVSKIRVAATNIQSDTTSAAAKYDEADQGLLNDDSDLQADVRNLNLPSGSQGPQGSGIWDNVRNPNLPNSDYSANQTASNLNFDAPSTSIFNSPGAAAVAQVSGLQLISGTATSLLQDNQSDDGYQNSNEPVTLTGGVHSTSDVQLQWDEYVDWTQVDDKGHYAPTTSSPATGYDLGHAVNGENGSYVTVHPFAGNGNPGTQRVTPVYSSYCDTYDRYGNCTHYTRYLAYYDYESQSVSCTNSSAYNTYSSVSWSTPNNESRFGWKNTQTINTGTIPVGPNGGNAASAWGGGYTNSNPAWSNTGTTAYWQDDAITPLNSSGALQAGAPSTAQHWIYDTGDPLYTSRMVYDSSAAYTYSNSYDYGRDCYYFYASSGHAPSTYTTTNYIAPYYSPTALYESTTSTPFHPTPGSLWGANATFDGRTDGTVQSGWNWIPNKQRVRYENTWNGRSRDLGSRSIDGDDADSSLLSPDFDDSVSQPSRGATTIYNPSINASGGDIFSGGDISGYFSGNTLSGAYLFANGIISQFSANGAYPGYYNNPSNRSNTTYSPGDPDPLHRIFGTHLDSSIANASNPSYPGGSTVNLNNKIYKTGDLTLGATTFCNGPGTIYVDGDLTINGNLTYCNGTTKANLASVGFVVTGSISIAPNVTSIVGSYVTNGTFTTNSRLTPDNRNAVTGDVPFTLNGSVIANSFLLNRQLSGVSMAAGLKPENFNYDGRVVVSPPPGFSSLDGAIKAILNEAVPRN